MQITIIAGARPNFMKIAPIIHAIMNAQQAGKDISYRLVHTGQHFDQKMSGDFFDQLNIPAPHTNLAAGGGTQAEQTAAIMIGFEKELVMNPTDLVLVVGDVTSTMACAIVAQKLQTKVAHVEAGIRSGDWTMPEEINRLLTDSITNYFFTTSRTADDNLKNSGVNEDHIFFVGNTMIDTLLTHMPRFRAPEFWNTMALRPKGYVVMTLHRPANVDNGEILKEMIETLLLSTRGIPVVFPVHPRTAKVIASLGIDSKLLMMVDPLGYLEFNFLVANSLAVVTDSGGITEEATVLKVPCMTLRDSTERPETVTVGTNALLGTNPSAIPPAFEKLFSGKWATGGIPELWDGNAAGRIVDIILKLHARK